MNTSPEAGASGTTPSSTLRNDRMERALARAGHAPLREGNRLTLLRGGPETFDEWIERIGRAERWVHFENYFFLADEVGHRFAGALSEKARQQGLERIDQIKYAVLERDGGISIIPEQRS